MLEGFGFGAALLAMFMRVGGGIFTKAADVGADLVGKVEQGIPEDDPRNAATIADNVGDNVGDCAGMAADLFESYAVTLVAALILGSQAFGDEGLVYPLLIPAIGALTAVLGVFITRPRAGENGLKTINRAFYISAAVGAVGLDRAVLHLPARQLRRLHNITGVDMATAEGDPRLIASAAVVIGIVMAAGILALTGYFTGTEYSRSRTSARPRSPVAATVILSGLSVGFESAVYTTLVIGAAVFGAFLLGGATLTVSLFAVALAGCGLLTTVGVIVAMDTFGPVSDNAQGIAEMSGDVSPEGAQILTELDAVGNTTKAITKGIAIATAVLAATALFGSYSTSVFESLAEANPAEDELDLLELRASSTRPCSSACCSVPPWSSCSPAWRSTPSAGPRVPWCSRCAASSARSPGSWRAPAVRSTARSSTSSRGLAARARHPGPPGGPRSDRRRLRSRRHRPGRLPRRCHRRRHPDGGLPGQLRAAPGTTPRSWSRTATTAARARLRTRPPSSATPSVTRSRTPPARRSTR